MRSAARTIFVASGVQEFHVGQGDSRHAGSESGIQMPGMAMWMKAVCARASAEEEEFFAEPALSAAEGIRMTCEGLRMPNHDEIPR